MIERVITMADVRRAVKEHRVREGERQVYAHLSYAWVGEGLREKRSMEISEESESLCTS